MAIDGGMRDKLEPGTKLIARYKGEQHVAEVVEGEEGKVYFRLADGRQFKSPSAAGSTVMGGQACNGWRFWSLAGSAETATTAKARAVRKPQPAGKTIKTRKPKPAAVVEPNEPPVEEVPA